MSDTPLDPSVLDMLRSLTSPGEPDVLREVLELYQEDMPRRLALLATAGETGDLQTLERTAHSIKGSAGNIGARALHEACAVVEQAARDQAIEPARAALPRLQTEAARVDAAIIALLRA